MYPPLSSWSAAAELVLDNAGEDDKLGVLVATAIKLLSPK